jgi:hypothetical protein
MKSDFGLELSIPELIQESTDEACDPFVPTLARGEYSVFWGMLTGKVVIAQGSFGRGKGEWTGHRGVRWSQHGSL